MSTSVASLGWGLVFLIVVMYSLIWLLGGGFFNYAKTALAMVPVVLVILMGVRRYWHVLLIAALSMDFFVVPVYGLNRLTPLFLLLSFAGVIHVMDLAREKRGHARASGWVERVVMAMALALVARYWVKRPGLAALGMASGGFMDAIFVIMAPWFFFVARSIVAAGVFTRRQLWTVAVVSAIANISAIWLAPGVEGVFWARKLALAPSWMMAASMLSLALTASPGLHKWVAFYGVSAVILAAGLISDYRSRTFFFIGQIGVSSYFGGILRRTLVFFAVGLVALAGWIGGVRRGEVPELLQRSLSVVIPEGHVARFGRAAPMGWQDSTRARLYELAWKEIRRRPLVGSGFGLSVREALSILAVQEGGGRAVELLAWSGGYHNSVIMLAAKAGIPVAAMFVIVSIALVWRFWRHLRRCKDRTWFAWNCSMLAFWMANTGMLLLNGGPREFFVAMVVNGIMAGMMIRPSPLSAPEPAPAAVSKP